MNDTVDLRGRRDVVRGLPIFARVSTGSPRDALPVVLIHGMVVSSVFLRDGARYLGVHHPTWAPDMPGYGHSAKPPRTYGIEEQGEFLGAWMDAVGLRRAAVVGVSLGSQFVSELAVKRPDLVERLVLTSPTMEPELRAWPKALLQWLKETPYEIGMAPIMLRDYARAGIGRALATGEISRADRIEERLPLIQAPTLVVRGSLDPLVSQEWAEEVTRLLPRGQLVAVEGQPHALNFTAPERFAEIIRDFLAEPADVPAPAGVSA